MQADSFGYTKAFCFLEAVVAVHWLQVYSLCELPIQVGPTGIHLQYLMYSLEVLADQLNLRMGWSSNLYITVVTKLPVGWTHRLWWNLLEW